MTFEQSESPAAVLVLGGPGLGSLQEPVLSMSGTPQTRNVKPERRGSFLTEETAAKGRLNRFFCIWM